MKCDLFANLRKRRYTVNVKLDIDTGSSKEVAEMEKILAVVDNLAQFESNKKAKNYSSRL